MAKKHGDAAIWNSTSCFSLHFCKRKNSLQYISTGFLGRLISSEEVGDGWYRGDGAGYWHFVTSIAGSLF